MKWPWIVATSGCCDCREAISRGDGPFFIIMNENHVDDVRDARVFASSFHSY